MLLVSMYVAMSHPRPDFCSMNERDTCRLPLALLSIYLLLKKYLYLCCFSVDGRACGENSC